MGYVADKRRILVNALGGMVARVLDITLLLWVYQHLVRRISPEEYSLLPVVSSAVLLLPLIATTFSSGVGRFVSEALALHDHEKITRIVSSVYGPLCIAAVGMLAAGGLVIWKCEAILRIAPGLLFDARLIAVLLLGVLTLRVLVSPFTVGLFARERFILINAIILGGQVLKIAVLLALLTGSTRVLWVAVAQSVSELAVTATTLVLSWRCLPALRFVPGAVDRALRRRLFRFGGWVTLDQAGLALYRAMDPIILNRFASAVDVVAFHLGSLPFRQIQPFLAALTKPFQPVMAALHAHENEVTLQNAFLRIGRYSLWILGFLACPLIAWREPLFRLYLGPRASLYSHAPHVMLLMFAAWVPACSLQGLSTLAASKERMRGYILSTTLSQVFNLGLTLFFLASLRLGAIGSALASLVALWMVYMVGLLPLALRGFGISGRRYLKEVIAEGLAPWPVTSLFYVLVKGHVTGWWSLIGLGLVGVGLYAGCSALLLSRTERLDVKHLLMRKKGIGQDQRN
jgi:O-antigen/teichoic acid export membrane protein